MVLSKYGLLRSLGESAISPGIFSRRIGSLACGLFLRLTSVTKDRTLENATPLGMQNISACMHDSRVSRRDIRLLLKANTIGMSVYIVCLCEYCIFPHFSLCRLAVDHWSANRVIINNLRRRKKKATQTTRAKKKTLFLMIIIMVCFLLKNKCLRYYF